ncbi:MAG: DUF4129 domain-containing protein [Bacteroidota bacterium]
MRILFLTYFILTIFCFSFSYGQQEQDAFDTEEIENLLKSEDFDQELKEKEVPYYGFEPAERIKNDKSAGNTSQESRESPKMNVQISNIMYGLVALFLCIIVGAILRNTMGGSGRKLKKEAIAGLEEDIQKLDTKALIAKAVAEGNYRLAIRLNYLDILKKLDEKNWISWRRNKTNQDYVQELRKSKHAQEFAHLTRQFDISWYGDFSISKELYEQIEPGFQGFYRKIGGRL